MISHQYIAILDASSIGEARRCAVRSAELAHFCESDVSRVSIIATELATNLIRHTKPGSGAIAITANTALPELEIFSLDTGTGLNDVSKCFQDGFSTGGTAGNGLGAVKRLSDELDLFSNPTGLVLWTRITPRSSSAPKAAKFELNISGFSVPAPNETVCGDAWRAVRSPDGRIAVMIADGLGHGPLASDAAKEACQSFDADPFTSPSALIETMHASISATRGAAVAIAQITPASQKLTYAGVGNISGTILAADATTRGLMSHNGIVGHQLRKCTNFDYKWPPDAILVMHSDGLHSRWSFDNYPGLRRRHPGVIAGVLLRDFRRGRDDSSVVVVGSTVNY